MSFTELEIPSGNKTQTTVGGSFEPATADETVPCVVCGGLKFSGICESSDFEYDLPGRFFVSQCENCGLIMQNPRPTFPEILRYYTETYEPFRTTGSMIVRSVRDFMLVRPRRALYRKMIGNSGTVIDIGCGNGAMLHEIIDEGWNLIGIEPVEEGAIAAREAGLHVVQSTLEDAGIPEETVDIATMYHVLEHLPDPKRTAQETLRILKPGGYFIGEVPSPDCIERRIWQEYWGGYHLPRHLTFFSMPLLHRFLSDLGFIEVKTTALLQPSSWLLSAGNYFRSKQRAGLSRFFSPHSLPLLAATTPASILLRAFGNAPIVRFVGRKPIGN